MSHTVDASRKKAMNLEQRNRIYQLIIQTQGLLAFAVKTGDKAEEDRLVRELAELIENAE